MLKNRQILRAISLFLTLVGSILLAEIGQRSVKSAAVVRNQSVNSTPSTNRFAVIGDFGIYATPEVAVATLVGGWQLDFIVTVGDNNYPDGAASTIDKNIGSLYHSYIYPYLGTAATPTPDATPGPSTNRFWPALGNHDWNSLTISTNAVSGPHMNYFTLPGNERYYDVVEGFVHLFVIDSDQREPDGVRATSKQAQWLKERLEASTAPWKLVLMHHSPYSSSATHGSTPRMQWPFREWGVDAVLSGHDHLYERLELDGVTYFVNGLGGAARYPFSTPVPGSVVRYTANHGAMLIEATAETLVFKMININEELIDEKVLSKKQSATYFLFLPLIQQ